MQKTVFLETIDGLMVEQVIRDHEYSMYSRHFHESYELYILLEGERYYFIDKETYLVRAGMAVLVGRNQIHKTSMAGDSYHDRMLMQMEAKVFAPFLQVAGAGTMESLFGQLNGVVEYSEQDWQAVVWLLSEIKQEMRQKRTGYQAVVNMMVVHLLTLTARNRRAQNKPVFISNASPLSRLFSPAEKSVEDQIKYQAENQTEYQARTPRHQTIREVTTYLLAHYQQRESLTSLASRFFVSKSYLCRIFKEVTGFTINEYQNLIRIKAAQKLLAETKLPITEVAAQVGFESITYFERVFKKHTDQRPLQYRRQQGRK